MLEMMGRQSTKLDQVLEEMASLREEVRGGLGGNRNRNRLQGIFFFDGGAPRQL